jgi:hypothetical protein
VFLSRIRLFLVFLHVSCLYDPKIADNSFFLIKKTPFAKKKTPFAYQKTPFSHQKHLKNTIFLSKPTIFPSKTPQKHHFPIKNPHFPSNFQCFGLCFHRFNAGRPDCRFAVHAAHYSAFHPKFRHYGHNRCVFDIKMVFLI